MQQYIWISILVFLLLVISALVVAVIAMRRPNVDTIQSGQALRPRGYWTSIGISIGVGFGVALGLIFDNLALGIAFGAAIGASIGAALELKNKGDILPATEQEGKIQKWGVIIGLLVLLLFVGIFTFILFLRAR